MQIGLIGGIGPAATDYYYRRLIAGFAARGASLDMTIAHADTPTLLANQTNGAAAVQALGQSGKNPRLDCGRGRAGGGDLHRRAFLPG